ncbi:hypothetical protein ACFLT2_04900 [Acidobacteriota bacterium]
MKKFTECTLLFGLAILIIGSFSYAMSGLLTTKTNAPILTIIDSENLRDESIEFKLPNSEGTLSLKAKIPSNWALNPDFGAIVYQPENKDDYFYPPLLQYGSSCGGSCDPKDIPKNIEKLIKGIKDTLARPNINTGDPELDAIRANVEILAEEKFADNAWILAAAVSYPEELSSAMYTPKIVVHAFRHHKDARFFIQTTARAQLTQKEEFLAVFLEACKHTDY